MIWLIGNKIADKIKSVSKNKSTKEWPDDETDAEIATPNKRYIYISRRKTTNYWWIKVSTKQRCIN